MKTLFFSFLLLAGTCFSQTKKIAYKSHSGNAAHYLTALHNNLFDMSCSNFGHAPNPIVKFAKLDSLIFVSDTEAVIVTSNICMNRSGSYSDVWSAGREKAKHHPLFSKKHSLDSIKNTLKQQYYFRNPIDSVVFVGYDNAAIPPSSQSSGSSQKHNSAPFGATGKQDPPHSNYPYILLGIIGSFSLMLTLIVRKINKLNSGV